MLRSFDDKTKTTIKTHRKRFIMFKSEQPKGNHTWGAYWHEYWEVARAALEHLAQDKRGEEKQKYINRELRQFMRIGQGEEIPFLAGSDTDLLEEWAKQVVTRVSEDSEIERLWQTLWRMPFTPCDIEQSIRWLSQSTEQGSETANGSTMGTPIAFRPLTAREVANRDRDGWYSNGPPDRLRYFSFGVSIPSGWFIPRVSLGWVYFRDKFRLFVLPESLIRN